MYDEDESYVVCDDVLLPNTIRLSPIKDDEKTPCFSKPAEMSLQRAMETAHVMETFPMPPTEGNFSSTVPITKSEERQIGACNMWSVATRRLGDGNPHQNYWRKQLSVS